MAEFCLECWKRMNRDKDDKRKYILSKDLDLCEGCGEWKSVIIAEYESYYDYKTRCLTLPFRLIFGVVCLIWRLLTFPFKHNKSKNKNIK